MEETSRRWISGASDVTGRNASSSSDPRRAGGGVSVTFSFAPGVAPVPLDVVLEHLEQGGRALWH